MAIVFTYNWIAIFCFPCFKYYDYRLRKEWMEECWLNAIVRYILTTNLRLVTDYSVKNHQVVRQSSNSVYHVSVYVVLKSFFGVLNFL